MPKIQDLELLPSPWLRCMSWLSPSSMTGETDVRSAFLPCPHVSMGKKKATNNWVHKSEATTKPYRTNVATGPSAEMSPQLRWSP